ncbi:3'-to-5' exonuclease YhaM [Citrifermentans bemidjiense Bem]|uniref:3'-to-5' exonuclease YhaM n=1 Tax=Citrifermentans bemidjiense (strain ATCC BAA-1014 / DSM 16622 / JCM 12645 / Bem) TaxID=404380 RepID=B5E9E1_CITBB|nr:HD domain-containing protein [Citrifermentans bemidjiense]ACH38683.1 3'-to-5' exonuclease YhaM [Citrifermentans bemidjiense Bem]
MKKKCVAEIKDRDLVEAVFLVKEKIVAMAKNGKPYLTLKLMDKSGEVDAKVWDNADQVGALFDRNDFLEVRAKASVYLGKMQLIVSELKKVPDDSVDLADFLPETDRDIEAMVEELHALVAGVKDPDLARLLSSFFHDPELLAQYSVAPAAKGMHHVYLGGLLEHSLAVAKLVDAMVPLYPGLNRDLLVAGALLHDVGKVREMTYLRCFDYSDEGKLIGHITIGAEMLHERITALPGFPAELAMLLKHMILSHHGQYEYGSPKRPKTLEATILNYLDDLDSKINGIRTHIRKEPDNPSRWTSYHRLYDRYFFKENCLPEEELELSPAAGLEPSELMPQTVEAPVPVPSPSSAPEQGAPRRERQEAPRAGQERKSFSNNPFAALKNGKE